MNIVHTGTIGDGRIGVRVDGARIIAVIPASAKGQAAVAPLFGKRVTLHVVIYDVGESHAIPEDSARYRAVAQALEAAKDVTALRAEVNGNSIILTSPRGIEHEMAMCDRISEWARARIDDERVERATDIAGFCAHLAANLHRALTQVVAGESGAADSARAYLDRIAASEDTVELLARCLGDQSAPTEGQG